MAKIQVKIGKLSQNSKKKSESLTSERFNNNGSILKGQRSSSTSSVSLKTNSEQDKKESRSKSVNPKSKKIEPKKETKLKKEKSLRKSLNLRTKMSPRRWKTVIIIRKIRKFSAILDIETGLGFEIKIPD